LDTINETIGLLHQTAQAREEQKAMEAQMEADRKAAAEKSETADKISAAELALKTADTVQASTYAKPRTPPLPTPWRVPRRSCSRGTSGPRR
jgi:DNA-binding protein H-NS